MISKLTSYAIGLVERKARDEAAKVLLYMKERYIFMFNHDIDSRIRVWTHKEDIQAIREIAESSCLTLLSVLAAIRLNNEADTIWETLFRALGESESQITQSTLASDTWEKIPATKTLITPVECLSVWKQLIKETEDTFTQANVAQEKYKQSELDEVWEEKLPHNYPRLIGMSDIPLNYSTKKELYFLFRQGFLANKGQLWFSTCESTRGICSILPATHVLNKDGSYNKLETLSLPESRFKETKKLGIDRIYKLTCKLESYMFSPHHYNYAWYLVFKFENGYVWSNDGTVFEARYYLNNNYIIIPITQGGPGMSEHYYEDTRPSSVEKRDDGWLEARLTKPLLKHHLEKLEELTVGFYNMSGKILNVMIVEGVEFRPVVVDYNGCIISSV